MNIEKFCGGCGDRPEYEKTDDEIAKLLEGQGAPTDFGLPSEISPNDILELAGPPDVTDTPETLNLPETPSEKAEREFYERLQRAIGENDNNDGGDFAGPSYGPRD